jgi:hypothetical protein
MLPRLPRLLALALPVALLLLSATAHPCWDGYAARIGGLTIQGGNDPARWSPDQARHVARWGTRIAALLPRGAEVLLDGNGTSCQGAACGALAASGATSQRLPEAFDRIARARNVPPAARRSAQRSSPEVFTVQVFAGSHAGARRTKARVLALGEGFYGFYEAGGFPATNDDAHVLRDGAIHRVVVGTYLDRSEADRARRALATKGLRGFVRALPSGTSLDERSFSRAG